MIVTPKGYYVALIKGSLASPNELIYKRHKLIVHTHHHATYSPVKWFDVHTKTFFTVMFKTKQEALKVAERMASEGQTASVAAARRYYRNNDFYVIGKPVYQIKWFDKNQLVRRTRTLQFDTIKPTQKLWIELLNSREFKYDAVSLIVMHKAKPILQLTRLCDIDGERELKPRYMKLDEVCLGTDALKFIYEYLTKYGSTEILSHVYFTMVSYINAAKKGKAKRIKQMKFLFRSNPTAYLSSFEKTLKNEDLQYLNFFPKLRTLTLDYAKIKGKDKLLYISTLKSLRNLYCNYTDLSNRDLYYISGIKTINRLLLQGNNISAKGIEFLKALPELDYLILSNNPIGDDGCKHLSKMENLKQLFLVNTQITDEGLAYLSRLTKLEQLDLSRNALSKEALAKLEKQLRFTIIYY